MAGNESTTTTTLTREQVKQLLSKRRGSISVLARRLGITTTSVSLVFQGKSESRRVWNAAHNYALELVAEDSKIMNQEAAN